MGGRESSKNKKIIYLFKDHRTGALLYNNNIKYIEISDLVVGVVLVA